MKADEKPKTAQQKANDRRSFHDIGTVTRKEHERLKRRAIKFEENNAQHILVIPCDGNQGWCEMSEHSALLYKYQVCMPLGVPVTLTDDFDSFYIQYVIGRIRTRGFDVVRDRLKKIKLYKDETEKDRCVVFRLTNRFSSEEMEKMQSEEMARQAAMNTIVKVTFSDPILYQKMIEVATRLHRICFRRLDKLSSATNGERMVALADAMIRVYYDMASSGKLTPAEKLEQWKQLKTYTHQLLVELQIVAALKLWTREVCVNVGESVLFLEERIDNQIAHESRRLKTNL